MSMSSRVRVSVPVDEDEKASYLAYGDANGRRTLRFNSSVPVPIRSVASAQLKENQRAGSAGKHLNSVC